MQDKFVYVWAAADANSYRTTCPSGWLGVTKPF